MANSRDGFVESIVVNTAEELMEKLAPSREFWKGDPQDWVFRGHGDSRYRLVPSSMRRDLPPVEKPVELLLNGGWVRGPMSTAREQRRGEFELLQRFFRLADAQGLPIPEDGHALRTLLSTAGPPDGAWPPKEMYSHVALAQHYGVPTRLLDWTRKPLVAAYFASRGAAQAVKETRAEPDQHLAVWAFRRRRGKDQDLYKSFGVSTVQAPRSGNPNLHLQSGLFTLHVDDGSGLDAAPDVRSLDDLLGSSGTVTGSEPSLREITMPAREAPKLLSLLRDHFVQAATIYAGYEGVKQSVLETKYRS